MMLEVAEAEAGSQNSEIGNQKADDAEEQAAHESVEQASTGAAGARTSPLL